MSVPSGPASVRGAQTGGEIENLRSEVGCVGLGEVHAAGVVFVRTGLRQIGDSPRVEKERRVLSPPDQADHPTRDTAAVRCRHP